MNDFVVLGGRGKVSRLLLIIKPDQSELVSRVEEGKDTKPQQLLPLNRDSHRLAYEHGRQIFLMKLLQLQRRGGSQACRGATNRSSLLSSAGRLQQGPPPHPPQRLIESYGRAITLLRSDQPPTAVEMSRSFNIYSPHKATAPVSCCAGRQGFTLSANV